MNSKYKWTENNFCCCLWGVFVIICLFVYKVSGGTEEGKLIKARVCSQMADGPSNEMLSAMCNREALVCEQLSLSAVSRALGLYVCGGLMKCGIFKDIVTMSLF